jgi:mycofactocin biosynthesis protein MftB
MNLALTELNPQQGYRVHPSVAVRPEPFGALVYHYGNRKLVFLKSKLLVTVVETLGEFPTLDAALDAAGVVSESRDRFISALNSMWRSDMLEVLPSLMTQEVV